MAGLLALDTNVYIEALRDKERLSRLKRFLLRTGLRVRVAAVVACELRAGARTAEQRDAVEALLRSYSERELVLTPSFDAFLEAGRVLSVLRTGAAGLVPSLTNDALIAASCREGGAELVTRDASDFAAIQRHLRGFRFTAAGEVLD
jgi:predicted nucleic acid-binding protein